nr:glycoside hydrolase N-terminal domain-containing protein [Saccharothrix sp.]
MYDEPASDWESRALPIGNGALGSTGFSSTSSACPGSWSPSGC